MYSRTSQNMDMVSSSGGIWERISRHPGLLPALTFVALCVCIVFADFSTKGEPREALVASDMLRSGNWVLPIDQNGDMAYKPPMFHWLVALFSLPAGHVSEFTSRLPSAISLTLLLMLVYKYCTSASRERGFGVLCAAFTLTCFEVLRAGTVCRVDMLLTLFITGGMICLFRAAREHRWQMYLYAVLYMSGGALTKGPVAVILPLGAWWVWQMSERKNFFSVSGKAFLLAVAAMISPMLWYAAAWHQGGDKFLTLALEENFGRFMGKMSYDSHVQPLWYNFTSLLAGLLPWSLLLAATVFLPRLRGSWSLFRRWKQTWAGMCPEARFALVASTVVFVFYCIPKSKRSVYLLPMYPFMAYGLGCYAQALVRRGVMSVKFMSRTLVTVCALLFAGFAVGFPIYSRHNSDRIKAEEIASIVPAGDIYTFIPDRFMRFYITDFYTGGRLVSLLPSGQVDVGERTFSADKMRLPSEGTFYLLTSADITDGRADKDFGLHRWLEDNALTATEVYRSTSRGHDVKRHFVLLKIARK